MERHQVIIVGAGPAGAACARALHDAGVQALILEKESLPRYKACSGVLFGQTQELLQQLFGSLPPEEMYCEPKTIQASQIIEWKHEQGFQQYFWEMPKDGHAFTETYLNAWRDQFDHWLVQQSGAAVKENCLVRGYAVEQDRVTVDVFLRDPEILEPGGTGDPNRTLQCDYLVGADGSASTVRRILAPDAWAAVPEVVYYQEFCPIEDTGDLREGYWHVFFEKSVAEMLCCVHRKGNFLVPCVGAFRGGNPRASMDTFKRFLREQFKVRLGTHERVEGVVIKMWSPDLGRGRVLLAGEAGGFRYLNDEGIDAAIDSGYRCGVAIARALREGGDALTCYTERTEDIVRHVQACTDQMHFMVE